VSDPVLLSVSDSVATITLNRPDALNSLTTAAKRALRSAVDTAATDRSVRAVLITGAGRGFCAGQDLREHADALDSGEGHALNTVRDDYNPIISRLIEMPKPVVAAVNGMAAGAGASLAFACDFRIAADSARFLLAFANVGLALDSGASWTLPRLIGLARATALALLADPVTAEHALEMGLVNAVVAEDLVLSAGLELATRLAAGPTAAYAAIKDQLRYAADAPLADALEHEAVLQVRTGATTDHRTAVAAFLNRERPTFVGE
jgi:2-(1,2-epoxy-1,2-dihydrophenyl)acetyl-CoA isomerase